MPESLSKDNGSNSNNNEDASPKKLTSMPLLPITSLDTIRKCHDLPLLPTDVFICSYPKSGTTWTQHIVLSLILKGLQHAEKNKSMDYKHVSDYAPFYEIDPHWDSNSDQLIESIQKKHNQLGRRVFNTHLRWDMLPDGKAKFIYLVRSPLDVCWSFYCHLSNQKEGGYEGTFDAFFQEWIEGKIAFGSWMDHILSFAPALCCEQEEQVVLLVSYEEMLSNLPNVVAKLSEFIGANVTEEEQQELLPTFSFTNMKNNLDRFQPRSVTWKNNFQFLRKGVSGDSKSVASEAQKNDLAKWIQREKFEEKLKSILVDHPEELEKIISCYDITKILLVCPFWNVGHG